jgi:hypothetical protein
VKTGAFNNYVSAVVWNEWFGFMHIFQLPRLWSAQLHKCVVKFGNAVVRAQDIELHGLDVRVGHVILLFFVVFPSAYWFNGTTLETFMCQYQEF